MDKVTGMRKRVKSMPDFDGATPKRAKNLGKRAGVHSSGAPQPSVEMNRPRPQQLGAMTGTYAG